MSAEQAQRALVDGRAQRAHDVRLEQAAQLVELDQLGRRDAPNPEAALGQDFDQPFGLELAQRLAGRCPGDAEHAAPPSFRSRRRPGRAGRGARARRMALVGLGGQRGVESPASARSVWPAVATRALLY